MRNTRNVRHAWPRAHDSKVILEERKRIQARWISGGPLALEEGEKWKKKPQRKKKSKILTIISFENGMIILLHVVNVTVAVVVPVAVAVTVAVAVAVAASFIAGNK